MNNIYDITLKDYVGNEVNFEKYKGKVLLIVNTATKCGFTNQYTALSDIYDKYVDKGFEILDFPCNQFLFQAPGTSEEIHDTCVLRFLIKFIQFEKIKVNGKEQCELYKYLKENSPEGKQGKINWNFTKFLVDRNGKIVDRFEPAIKPEDIEGDIVKLL